MPCARCHHEPELHTYLFDDAGTYGACRRPTCACERYEGPEGDI